MNLGDGAWNASKGRKERETCHEKKILSELVHFLILFVFFRLKYAPTSVARGLALTVEYMGGCRQTAMHGIKALPSNAVLYRPHPQELE